ncbi:hypothetical protein [Kitasatospora cheerisanensis]|uniref:Uncharacterized protein n=1 Tax=Kitasatospora cheerisanensis KCTC 2395 TaxID=1348663 RepID=A0A066Z0W5_9ACTN|nr:hypothetical protein [Kitasatospora cheerisanensis]KDN87428.1 hypothetical protein KCH_08000 [Kitasatospora cheerisanensis KCTC 2395]
MESDEVMLAVRLTTADRTLLRRLAHGHRGDVSEVVADALLDVLPFLLTGGTPQLADELRRFAPCAVTVWLPPELAELLPALADRMAELSGVRPGSPCEALGTAVRLWLRQDPARLAAGLRTLHHADVRTHHLHHRAQPVAA